MKSFTLTFIVAALLCGCTPQVEVTIAPTPASGDFQDVWIHASETSAVIYWMSPVPAGSKVAYGLSKKYDLKSEEKAENHVNGDPYYTHVHRLANLQPDKTYNFRMSYTGADGKEVVADNRQFSTKTSTAIRIPSDEQEYPIVLDTPGDYILTKDIKAGGTAIEISAKVNLDLDSHTITYNQNVIIPVETRNNDPFMDSACYGIYLATGAKGSKITNGYILQGAGAGKAQRHGQGFNPIALRRVNGVVEIAGLDITFHGIDVRATVGRSTKDVIYAHNNVFNDKGEIIYNRHQFKPILSAKGSAVHNNLITRYRHVGISSGGDNGEIYRNEAYGHTVADNHCSVMVYNSKNVQVHDNYLFSRSNTNIKKQVAGGGIYVNSRCRDIKVYRNKIHLVADGPKAQMSGVRITFGGQNIEWFENDIFVTGGGAKIRGTWLVATAPAPPLDPAKAAAKAAAKAVRKAKRAAAYEARKVAKMSDEEAEKYLAKKAAKAAKKAAKIAKAAARRDAKIAKMSEEEAEEFLKKEAAKAAERAAARAAGKISREITKNIVFRDNKVRLIAGEGGPKAAWAISAIGKTNRFDSEPVLYKNNLIISNVCNVGFGETYGQGYNHRFVGNTFVREGNDERYRTINCGWGNANYTTFGHVFVDSKFEGGAGFDTTIFRGEGRRSFGVGWTVKIKTSPGAEVVIVEAGRPKASPATLQPTTAPATRAAIAEAFKVEAFRGKADADGNVTAYLAEYIHSDAGKTDASKYVVTAELAAEKGTIQIVVNKNLQIDLPL